MWNHNDRPGWFDGARCRGMDPALFFPDSKNRSQSVLTTRAAKAVCNGTADVRYPGGQIKLRGEAPCPVRQQCLEWGISHHEKEGVWGGTSERDRRKIVKLRRRQTTRRATPQPYRRPGRADVVADRRGA